MKEGQRIENQLNERQEEKNKQTIKNKKGQSEQTEQWILENVNTVGSRRVSSRYCKR